MQFWRHTTLLLDQVPDFHAMGDHFRAESATINVPHLFVLAMAVLVISSLIWALSRWQESSTQENSLDSPQRLFTDLCKVHELGTAEMSLLRKIARELQLPHPASLFVDPAVLISALQLEKFDTLQEDLKKLGEDFFGFHLWRQALASDQTRTNDSGSPG